MEDTTDSHLDNVRSFLDRVAREPEILFSRAWGVETSEKLSERTGERSKFLRAIKMVRGEIVEIFANYGDEHVEQLGILSAKTTSDYEACGSTFSDLELKAHHYQTNPEENWWLTARYAEQGNLFDLEVSTDTNDLTKESEIIKLDGELLRDILNGRNYDRHDVIQYPIQISPGLTPNTRNAIFGRNLSRLDRNKKKKTRSVKLLLEGFPIHIHSPDDIIAWFRAMVEKATRTGKNQTVGAP